MMTQKIILIFTVLFTSFLPGFAESSPNDSETNTIKFSGIVCDKVTGEPLVGVKVRIEGSTKEVYTNFDGKFEFDNLTPGEYSFTCNLVAYDVFKLCHIVVGNEIANSNVTFQLKPIVYKPNLKKRVNGFDSPLINIG